ncbi:15893_t:CDS:2, partial [Racocetra fulgida]
RDPKQLGPFVYSPIAKELGLGQSLIERLAKTKYYDFSSTCKYGVKLLINYRTHPEILKFPNATFYEDELQPSGYVLAVVRQLLKEKVKPEDIGIISPYVKQREKINKLLKHKGINGVEIGTVEKFQ